VTSPKIFQSIWPYLGLQALALGLVIAFRRSRSGCQHHGALTARRRTGAVCSALAAVPARAS